MNKACLLLLLILITGCINITEKPASISLDSNLVEETPCYYWEKLTKTKNYIGKTICVFGIIKDVEVDRNFSVFAFSNGEEYFALKAKGNYQNKLDYCVSGNVYIDSQFSGVTMPVNDENTMTDCPLDLVEKAIELEQ